MRYAQEPSRARHLLVLAAAAAVLVALVALIALGVKVATGNGEDQGSSTTNGTDPGADVAGSSPDAGEWETDTDTGLPMAATSQDGHPVGFPRTADGAAAMVVGLNRAQIGLDYDDALTTIRTYAAETDQTFFDDLATSAIAQRRKTLGVPVEAGSEAGSEGGGEDADVLAPAGYAQTPIGYQVEEYGADRYLVSVINEVSATTANGQVERSAYVGQQLVAWNPDTQRATDDGGVSGDWELVEPSAEDRDRLLATDPPATAPLGTPEFEQAGWTPLLESSTNSSTNSSADSPSSDGSDQSADEQ
ncbi:hypothetical protein [Nocardioides marmoraquaticus]